MMRRAGLRGVMQGKVQEDLKELGFEGYQDRVAAFARTCRKGQTEKVNPASKRIDVADDLGREAEAEAAVKLRISSS